MSKPNVSRDRAVAWNHYAIGSVEDALKAIYDQAQAQSEKLRGWYWSGIRAKKYSSVVARVVSYLFAAAGVLAPLTAAMAADAQEKLLLTQAGVLALVVAGLAQVSDRVFGWSSGWQRYVTTVTIMERLTAQFELAWARWLLDRDAPLQLSDVLEPFELAKAFTLELEYLRDSETNAWVAEFNAGLVALSEIAKLKREAPAPDPPRRSITTVTATTSAPVPGPGTAPFSATDGTPR